MRLALPPFHSELCLQLYLNVSCSSEKVYDSFYQVLLLMPLGILAEAQKTWALEILPGRFFGPQEHGYTEFNCFIWVIELQHLPFPEYFILDKLRSLHSSVKGKVWLTKQNKGKQ